jgi:protein involved in polysaccharide export with SLBB domain
MQRRRLLAAFLVSAALAPLAGAPALGRQRQDPGFPNIGYATWSDDEPAYRLYPGDEVDFQVGSAPELNKILIVQPDGRVSLPLVGSVMAADRSVDDLQARIVEAYGRTLLRPDVTVALRTAQPLKVFVGGEVSKPGVYDMPGDLDALRAVILAGGFTNSAKRGEVVIIRRGPGGRPMMRTADMGKALRDPAHIDLVPLRRFDIVYVPKSGVAEAGQFVQQYFRDLTPVTLGFSYALGSGIVP